jgi:16S rRNA (uracil1498-N3)-methyltransferase
MSLPVHVVETLVGVAVGDVVEVTGDEGHHAVAVRRLRPGERVVLTDGSGTSLTGEVASVDKRALGVRVLSISRTERREPSVTVVQALAKGERGERAVELLTEVGVDRIVPWAAARSVAVWRGDRADRSLAKWRATAREAAKQSRRSWFPEVTGLATTEQVVVLLAEADLAVVLHEDATLPMAALEVPNTGSIVVVVGPEGGLAPEELEQLSTPGARPVRLGDEVLRTSTAGVVAVAALLARTSRWS